MNFVHLKNKSLKKLYKRLKKPNAGLEKVNLRNIPLKSLKKVFFDHAVFYIYTLQIFVAKLIVSFLECTPKRF